MNQKKYNRLMEEQEEVNEIQNKQEEICRMVRRIWSLPLLEKAEDFLKRIYRRGAR